MKIKAVLYDLGDIFFEAHFWRKWMFEQAQIHNYKATFFDFYTLWEDYLLPVYENRQSYDSAFRAFIEELKMPEGFYEEAMQKKLFYEKNRVLFEGVSETLSALHDKHILNVVVTDNEQESRAIRDSILGKFQLNSVVDEVITSCDFGLTKDTPELFYKTVKRLKLNPSETLFVGHDKCEIDSARQSGIKTVVFNNYLQVKINSDYNIESFSQLQNIVF